MKMAPMLAPEVRMVPRILATTDENAAAIAGLTEGLDNAWIIMCAALVFLMQAGFAMLSAGSVRSKNATNILLKNVMDACAGAIGFWSFGYAFAYGDEVPNAMIGDKYFFLSNWPADGHDPKFFFFQFAFAATAATIVSGAMAERTQYVAYIGYSFFLTAFVYPVVVHWGWSGSGWLSAFNSHSDKLLDVGIVDFAGCCIVHMVGGVAALWGAIFVGPRMGRFMPSANGDIVAVPLAGHSIPLTTLGTFLLWFGWYGFNPGSTLLISPAGYGFTAGLAAVNTTLSAAAGAFASLYLSFGISSRNGEGIWDLCMALNGALAGLVSITSGCATMDPWAAVISGVLGGFVYYGASNLMKMLLIDDPLDAVAVHLFCGMWGAVAAGLFSSEERMAAVYGSTKFGLFMGGDGNLFGCQIIGILAVFAWVTALMAPFFAALKAAGVLRVSEEDERLGLDLSHHGGSAYTMEGGMDGDDKGEDAL